jgi:hypothetical protein
MRALIAVVAVVAAAAVALASATPRGPFGTDAAKCKTPACRNAERVGNALTGKYPWQTGISLTPNPASKIRLDFFLCYACDDCAAHWFGIVLPLINKYGSRISVYLQPFPLPYQPYAYDAANAAWSVYRLLGNSTSALITYSTKLFQEQDKFFNAYELSQSTVWHDWFGAWAEPLGVRTERLIAAMNGTITTANYDAWYSARFARQRTFDGAPGILINFWYPIELHLAEWTLTQWEKWIDSNL